MGKNREVRHGRPLQELVMENYKGPVQVVRTANLRPLAVRPALSDYVVALWKRRFFIVADAKAKALRTTRDYRLWKTWLVLSPLFDVMVYGFLFGVVFKTSAGVPNFVGFLFIGVIFMKMMSGLLMNGSGLIPQSRSMIRAFSFPRASIPVAETLRSFIDNLLPAVVAICAAFALQWGVWPRWTVILLVPLYIMIHIFGCGLTLIFARLTAEFPDVKVVLGLATQAWFFLSGVMYTADRFAHTPVAHVIMVNNPAYVFLTAVRDVTIYGTVPALDVWLVLTAWSVGGFVVGFVYFWLAEEKYVRLV